MKIAGQFCRMVLAFPLVLPAFVFTMVAFILESALFSDRGYYFHPVSDFIDRVCLDPLNNFIDYGRFKCS